MTAQSTELTNRWLKDAETFRRWGDEHQASILERCVEDLEAFLRESDLEPLTLAQASRESGYTPDHLRRLIREGKLTNVGRRNAPRIRRGDLPQKPRRFDSSLDTTDLEVASKEQIARSIVADGGIR